MIERYELLARLPAPQDLLLTDFDPAWRADVPATLQAGGIKDLTEIDPIDLLSMACPALPLCGRGLHSFTFQLNLSRV